MTGQSTEDTFFEGKRPWSIIKDQIIGTYIKPFTRKVAQRKRPILIIDAFAGPGVFEDGTPGSPLIICSAVAGVAAPWHAIFINRSKRHHEQLSAIIHEHKWSSNALPLLGDTTNALHERVEQLTNETVFLYLDPFGLKGCNFQTIARYLQRSRVGHSVEILINMSMPTLHRLAAVEAVMKGKRDNPQIEALNRTLSNALGGRWWQEVMWTREEPHAKESAIMAHFANQLATFLPYTGYCPVRESGDSAVKYYITFASAHPDAQVLMNDIMLKAYEGYIYRREAGQQHTLWGWETGRDLAELEQAILAVVQANPNHSREAVWALIVQRHFMRWLQKEYHATLKKLASERRIIYPPDPETGKQNQHSILSLLS